MAITKDGNGVISYTPAPNQTRNEQSGTVVDGEFAIIDETNVLKQIKFQITPTSNNPGVATLNVNIGADATIDLTGAGVASGITYTPGIPGNWSLQPATVADGLNYSMRRPYGRYRGWITSASSVNINTASFANATPIDGVAVADGDSVFLLNQTAPAENGVWVYNAGTTNFSRHGDYPVGMALKFADLFFVVQGATHGNSLRILNHGFTIGSAVDQNSLDTVVNGASGTFTTADAKTVTVANGLITSIV